MNVVILYSQINLISAKTAAKEIEKQSIKVEIIETDTVWDKKIHKNPLHILEETTHLVYIYSHSSEDLSSFAFFAGLAIGRGIRLIILETDSQIFVPENCLHLAVVLSPSNFEEFLNTEKLRFQEENKRARARKKLLDQGIPCFDDSFIQVVSLLDVDATLLFLEAGFLPNLKDSNGTPVLSLATRSNGPEIVEILLEAGADINVQSLDRGYSALMDAAQKGDLVIGKILLSYGALPNLKSKDGQTALTISAGRGDVEFSKLLVSYNADPSIKDNLGMSALSYATLFKNDKLLELFTGSST